MIISDSRRGIFRRPPIQDFHHVADHPDHVFDHRTGGHMGCEQDVVEAEQRIVGLGRFRIEHVDGGGDVHLADRGCERGIVENFAAAGVDGRDGSWEDRG